MKRSIFALAVLLVFNTVWSCKSTQQTASKPSGSNGIASGVLSERQNAHFFSQGINQKIAGENDKAIASFQQALNANPVDHASMYELSALFAGVSRMDEAISYMKQAIELESTNKWYKIRLAQLYKFTGDYESTARIYRELLLEQPESTEYFGELSSALLLLEKYDEAIEVFNQIETQIGVNEMLSLQKQQIYLSLDQPDKATAEVEKLAETFPFEPRYQAMLAEIYMGTNKKLKAHKAYERIRELDPDDPYVHVSLSEYYRQEGDLEKAFQELLIALRNPALDIDMKVQVLSFWFQGAEINTGIHSKAIAIAEALIQTHPESPRGYQILGDVLMDEKEYDGANDNYIQALEIDSSNYVIWENLLFTDLNLQDFDALQKHSKRCISLFPVLPLPYLFNGIACYQNEKYEEALKSFDDGRKFVVGNDRLLGEFYNYTGEVQQKLGNFSASALAYDKALIINPDNATVLNNYAYYLSLRNEQLEKALEMAKKANEIDPLNLSNIDTYAWVYYKLGRFDDALRWIEKAISSDEKPSGTILEHYGDILFRLKRTDEALDWWKKAKTAGECSENIDQKISDKQLYE